MMDSELRWALSSSTVLQGPACKMSILCPSINLPPVGATPPQVAIEDLGES